MRTKSRYPSITGYLREGHRAAEMRLQQLEREIIFAKARLVGVAKLSLRVRKRLRHYSTLSGRTVVRALPRAIMKVNFLGRRTLTEMRAEHAALRNFLGNHLRVWEAAPAGPAPI